MAMNDAEALRRIKLLHTFIWVFFAGCIVAIPVFTWRGEWRAAFGLIAVVMVEVVILFANRMRCPLTAIAARHTDDRDANFDIYLPLWLARHNQRIFGTLYVLALAYALFRWRAT